MSTHNIYFCGEIKIFSRCSLLHVSGAMIDWSSFNDTSTLVGHFVSSPREKEKIHRRESRGDEREGQGRKRKMNEGEETKAIKHSPSTHTCCYEAGLAQLRPTVSQYQLGPLMTQDIQHLLLLWQKTTWEYLGLFVFLSYRKNFVGTQKWVWIIQSKQTCQWCYIHRGFTVLWNQWPVLQLKVAMGSFTQVISLLALSTLIKHRVLVTLTKSITFLILHILMYV